jgi:diphthine-ammonia ligase
MYQTVGHRAVAAYGELTGLPLFRRRIAGTSHPTPLNPKP